MRKCAAEHVSGSTLAQPPPHSRSNSFSALARSCSAFTQLLTLLRSQKDALLERLGGKGGVTKEEVTFYRDCRPERVRKQGEGRGVAKGGGGITHADGKALESPATSITGRLGPQGGVGGGGWGPDRGPHRFPPRRRGALGRGALREGLRR